MYRNAVFLHGVWREGRAGRKAKQALTSSKRSERVATTGCEKVSDGHA